MSPNARWRCLKIVTPQDPNQEQELSRGLQNALLRGEDITKAKQSFINAGYKPEEIEAAAQKIPMTSKISQQASASTKQQCQSTIQYKKKRTSKKFLVITIISISILILVGAALLGLFWNKIF